ncbi:unnamed protein product [Owenia fusiformis]|uniref:Ribosomal protein eL8/eL30/eS12/Gadd45 domain-containing protein n=1 Tax=Owenia fusiformis TaxID=6347 RepID=A0A8S4N2C5_OWEFU|nr:unnamed protein product [Owenia fusiformis]
MYRKLNIMRMNSMDSMGSACSTCSPCIDTESQNVFDMDFTKINRDTMDIGASLKETLKSAHETGRTTCGVYECAQVLETNPDNIMMCLLPSSSDDDDVTMHIHFTLIEAFCWENDIRLMRVDSAEKLSKILGKTKNDNERPTRTEDFNCVLVEYPTSETSEFEEDMAEYYKKTCHMNPSPIIALP